MGSISERETYSIVASRSCFSTALFFSTLMISMCVCKTCEWKCLYHLPGLHVIKYISFLMSLTTAVNEMDFATRHAENVISWINTCPELEENKSWSWEMIENFINDGLEENTKNDLKVMFKNWLQNKKNARNEE